MPTQNPDRTAQLADQIFRNAAGTLELYTIYLGERLGLYRALAQGGPATSAELAERTGVAERYAREWLEHQGASGLIEVDDAAAEPSVRLYTLPPEHIPVLVDPDDIRFGIPSAIELARVARQLPALVEAYQTGDAPPPLPWPPEGRAEPNRTRFLNLLGKEWIPAVEDIDIRLRADPPARVADLACGTGWSSIAMALAYPQVTVHGLDLDEAAIAAARRHAQQAGVTDRVTFSTSDASDLRGQYDLVTIIEALHDMSRPVETLRTARAMRSDGATVLVIDGRVQEEFTAPAPLRDRYEYAWSVLACLPSAMDDPQTAATGAVMRPATLRRYATEAGFGAVEVLPIETDYWRFYRLTG